MRQQGCGSNLLAQGRLGIVDAALVRWLNAQRTQADRLLIHVTQSVFEPVLSRQHIEEFLAALEPVHEVVRESELVASPSQARAMTENPGVITWPESELLSYSVHHICKREPLVEEEIASRKLITLNRLSTIYGARPRRRETVGVVSGMFDLIHPGHVRLITAAKQMVDVLVVLTMSTAAIRAQEKNRLGDRPIYNCRDRIDVLSALRPVDHIVMLDDLNCLRALGQFCPDHFIKSAYDQARAIVQNEALLVEELGGKTTYLSDHHQSNSSTSIIEYVRQYIETQGNIFRR